MPSRNVQCPVCGAVLSVPPGVADCFVRCGTCRHRFRLPRQISVTDEAIAEWLWQAKPASAQQQEQGQEQTPVEKPPEVVSGKTAVLPALSDKIRLVRVDQLGATFEFPAKRLTDPSFRCAMPRQCLRCSERVHLEAHVIIYAPLMQDSFTTESQHIRPDWVGDPEISRLSGQELLSALPEVSKVSPPANLPMPYWLCDMCDGEGLIAAQAQINAATGQGTCLLRIGNLRRAEEFMVSAGGGGSSEHAEFIRHIASHREQPWDTLPQTIQNRLKSWYTPAKGEHFQAYIPDRERPRSEDGASGVLLTNQRMICRAQSDHFEVRLGDRVRLQAPSAGGRIRLRIKTREWEVKRLTVDRAGVDQLKRALSAVKFNAVWY